MIPNPSFVSMERKLLPWKDQGIWREVWTPVSQTARNLMPVRTATELQKPEYREFLTACGNQFSTISVSGFYTWLLWVTGWYMVPCLVTTCLGSRRGDLRTWRWPGMLPWWSLWLAWMFSVCDLECCSPRFSISSLFEDGQVEANMVAQYKRRAWEKKTFT